jgi:PAS domain S-box-containing protein
MVEKDLAAFVELETTTIYSIQGSLMNNTSDVQSIEQANEHRVHVSRILSEIRSSSTDSKQLLLEREMVAWKRLDAMADMVILVDSHGAILWANNNTAKHLNKSLEALIGICIWDIYPIQKTNHHKILFHEVTMLGRPISFVDKIEDRWIEMLIHPINDDNGELEEVVYQARDITAQIEAEEALKRISLQLVTVQEDERRRIAQDLHDEIGQQMTALLLELRSVQNAIGTSDEMIADQIGGAIRNLESIMKGLRQIFYQLYPPSLHHTTLTKVLSAHCSSFTRSTGIRVDFSCPDGFPVLSDVYEVTLYRFVQEGLANAVKHGRARTVWINLDVSDEEISISLEDDGLGFDPGKSLPGLGLRGIQKRFLMLKGSFDIESAPDKGTKLFGSLLLKTSET